MPYRITVPEVYALVSRLEARSRSKFAEERPELQKDIALAAKVLATLLALEILSAPLELM